MHFYIIRLLRPSIYMHLLRNKNYIELPALKKIYLPTQHLGEALAEALTN